LVAPQRHRWWVALAGCAFVVGVALTLLTAHDHRLGDILGAFLVVSVWSTVAIRLGRPRDRQGASTVANRLFGRPLIAVAIACGAIALVLATRALSPGHHVVNWYGVDGAQALMAECLGATAAGLCTFRGLLRRFTSSSSEP
jgi:hypothetical protein